ncbi:fucose-1-phosphate guanylyltransferase isoform X2 [Electrophorus electricus]|uniref:GDP-fucose pyrophosphorylase domain-containing protein n=1 Tax=Electrophorus electricus TaxID=8005 RepID=A0A4W4FUU6_ELEEL|nr:fucose-1-phosphate guanylyltransferase isoform X2 [Electrophorus electricus]
MTEHAKNIHLEKASRKKLEKFNKMRGVEVESGEFWDLVVLTAVDEEQKRAYELQIRHKCDRKEIPLGIQYHVIADPPGRKIGNGGSTLHSLQLLNDQYGEALSKFKVLLIHAGGLSQRLPNASALGKIFTALPMGEPLYQMLELKMAMYVDFPPHMKPGVLVTCADDIELYSTSESVMFRRPGFTALAHPSPVSIGTTHGVFVLEAARDSEIRDMEYRTCFQYLHKPSVQRMHKSGAVCRNADGDFVYTDSTYYVDYGTAVILLNLFRDIRPLTCEVDAYGDFLQALGPGATVEYTQNTANVTKKETSLMEIREKIFYCLRGMPLNVILLNESKFYHLGTTEEYLFHFTTDPCLRGKLGLLPAAFSVCPLEVSEEMAAPHCVMHSVLHHSASVSEGSVVEYSKLESAATVGTRSIVSGCWVEAGLSVPRETFMHSLSVRLGGGTGFVTVAFGVQDNLKRSVSSPADMKDLQLFGAALDHCASCWGLCAEDVRFSGDGSVCNLWDCCLFLVCEDLKCSFAKTLEMVWAVLGKGKVTLPKHTKRLSLREALQNKDLEQMLEFRKTLHEEILQAG